MSKRIFAHASGLRLEEKLDGGGQKSNPKNVVLCIRGLENLGLLCSKVEHVL